MLHPMVEKIASGRDNEFVLVTLISGKAGGYPECFVPMDDFLKKPAVWQELGPKEKFGKEAVKCPQER